MSVILTTLDPIAVSVLSGAPLYLGWKQDRLTPDCFQLKHTQSTDIHTRPLNTVTIESTAGAPYYSQFPAPQPSMLGIPGFDGFDDLTLLIGTVSYPTPKKYPVFRLVTKILRAQGLDPLPALATWQVTDYDKKYWQQGVDSKKVGFSGPPRIDWKHRFKILHNCPYLLPKYTQLIYWITTHTLTSGGRLNKFQHHRARCPYCNAIANTEHMFSTCQKVIECWQEADNMGRSIWPSYTPFKYSHDITILATEYSGPLLFKLSVVWILWRKWCEFFYKVENGQPIEDYYECWVPAMMLDLKQELLNRVREAPAVIAWMQLVQQRRITPSHQPGHIPEKMFLLQVPLAVTANPVTYDKMSLTVQKTFKHVWMQTTSLCRIIGSKINFSFGLFQGYGDWLHDLQQPEDMPEPDLVDAAGAQWMCCDY